MQSRQPLQTSGWMYTVSNSVRMMALVGHTSMQLASAQCLQTSLIMLQATAPLGVVRSWNWTWRQFCSSSWPVLSYPSPNAGACPGSWFHSLHATSQALQPMQSVVSVKKPTVRAMVVLLSDRHQIGDDLREAALLDVEVERQRDELVDDRHGLGLLAKIDRDQVLLARFTAVGPQVRKALGIGEDRQLACGLLAAARTCHPLVDPALAAAAACEHARPAHERLAGVGQVRELRQSAAARARAFGPMAGTGRAGRRPQRFEHRCRRGPRQIFVDGVLRLAREPAADQLHRLAVAEPVLHGSRQHRRARGQRRFHDVTHDSFRHVRGDSRGLGPVVASLEKGGFLRVEQRFVEAQELGREWIARGELAGPAPPPGPRLGRADEGDLVHPIFSMFTRNALNSGVRELASPTNGVSALASQLAPLLGSRSAAMPTKPQ